MTVDDLTGYLHRCGTLDFDVYTRLDSRTRPDPRTRLELLRAARMKHDCPLPDPDLLLERVGKRVNDVKAALNAMPSSKTIRDELYAIADDESFLANVIAAMSQGAIRNKADLGDLLRRMRSYVVGAAELALEADTLAPCTEMTLRMQCAMMTARLSVVKTVFDANQIDDATTAAFASNSHAPSNGGAIDATPRAALTASCRVPSKNGSKGMPTRRRASPIGNVCLCGDRQGSRGLRKRRICSRVHDDASRLRAHHACDSRVRLWRSGSLSVVPLRRHSQSAIAPRSPRW
jgi:hypothetical protein